MTTIARSFWRCDLDGETFVASWRIIAHDESGNEVEPPPGVDVVFPREGLPCPVCGDPMRRCVGLFDQRDWAEQFA